MKPGSGMRGIVCDFILISPAQTSVICEESLYLLCSISLALKSFSNFSKYCVIVTVIVYTCELLEFWAYESLQILLISTARSSEQVYAPCLTRSLTVVRSMRLSSGYRNGPLDGCVCSLYSNSLLSSKKLKGLIMGGGSGRGAIT